MQVITIRLIVAIILILIVTKQRRILPTPQILFQPSIALRIHISLSAKQTEKYRKQYKRMRSSPDDKRNPDSKIVDIEDLTRLISNLNNEMIHNESSPSSVSRPVHQHLGSS